jgi:hypothetical protein
MEVAMFQNNGFNFDADHHFHFSREVPMMPKPGIWNYDSTKGIIKITDQKGDGLLMNIKIVEKHDTTYFKFDEALWFLELFISN